MISKANHLRVLLAAAITASPFAVEADDYHYRNMLIGDRAAGMGGAYTAVSDDPAGLYYNPAGITFMSGRNLSASMNAYHITNISYRDVLGGGDWTRESSSLLPNFFGVTQPLGGGVIGFSYVVTDSIIENQDNVLHNLPSSIPNTTISRNIINVNNNENNYKIGPTYARRINDDLSVGLTLYMHSRSTETISNEMNEIAYPTDVTPSLELHLNSYLQTQEYGIEPVLGIMWSPFDKLSLGASLRKTELLSASRDYQVTCSSNLATPPLAICTQPATTQLSSTSAMREYPLQITLGAAYFPNQSLIYSIDYSFFTEASNDYSSSVDDTFRTKEATWNLNAGVEYYLSNRWAVRTGAYTNRANTPSLSSSQVGQPQHIDMYGFSLSGSRFSRNSSLTLGMSYATGSGQAQVVGGSTSIQDVDSYSLSLFLSSSYSF